MRTDEELNALVGALEAWSPLVASGYEVPAASRAINDAASAIRQLMRERDEAVRVMRTAADTLSFASIYDFLAKHPPAQS